MQIYFPNRLYITVTVLIASEGRKYNYTCFKYEKAPYYCSVISVLYCIRFEFKMVIFYNIR